jgi:hypothetical protein
MFVSLLGKALGIQCFCQDHRHSELIRANFYDDIAFNKQNLPNSFKI